MEQETCLREMTAPLLLWYDLHRRDLPWRHTKDAYRIWLSEIMLQQTRVSAVIPYYERFLSVCPDVTALAALPEEKLFKLWEGLGYYSRARNLHRAAQLVTQEYGAHFPASAQELRKLPGVGPYTAAAVASIAFGEAVPAVDGNLLRVAARTALICEDITDAKVRRRITRMLSLAIDRERPGEYNQAMMDLGATVCLPNGAPKCGECPLRVRCMAYRRGMTQTLPVRAEKKPRRIEEKTVLLLRSGGKLALRRRPDKGLLAGLWEFPNFPGNLDPAGVEIALAQYGFRAEKITPLPASRHVFTHVEWEMKGYLCEAEGENAELRFAGASELEEHAIPSAFRVYTALAREALGGK